jgi:hypothetical protein
MEFIKYHTKEEFLENNLDILLKEEAKNEIMIGIVLEHEKSKVDTWFFGRIEENSEVELIFLIENDKNGLLLYSPKSSVSEKVLEFLINNIINYKINLKEIYAEINIVERFNEIYIRKTNKIVSNTYVTDTLKLVEIKEEHVLNNSEKLIKLEEDNVDLDKMSQIVKDIHLDIYNGVECTDEDALRIAKIYLKKGLYILTNIEENEVYCHTVTVRKQVNGCAIGAIISPKEYRGKGYGKKCVYGVCKRLLNENNKYIVLHVRDDNGAARNVYERIGFEMIDKCKKIIY